MTGLSAPSDRALSLGPALPKIPERLLLAHARGEVLFIVGAGISQAADLPDFRGLVIHVYKKLDPAVHAVIKEVPGSACNQWEPKLNSLNPQQAAEAKRFVARDYDVVLGMLERRMEGHAGPASLVRDTIRDRLAKAEKPASAHLAIVRLADRGGVVTVLTTNFDLLLEKAARQIRVPVASRALGDIPRPSQRQEFSGILHIHGSLHSSTRGSGNLVVTDRDFGEYYLRHRMVPDLIYDAARLFNLVLVGYSANDPPMRYLLNAVAADGEKFRDLKERFVFLAQDKHDPISLEDWRGRGITPIPYDPNVGHRALTQTIQRWAKLSAVNGNPRHLDAEIRRIVRTAREDVPDNDRDLFDHLIRRSNVNECVRLAKLASKSKADISWVDAISEVSAEPDQSQ